MFTNYKQVKRVNKFQNYPLPLLEHLSLSIYYVDHRNGKGDVLDIIFKDEYEYDMWLAGLRALVYHFK